MISNNQNTLNSYRTEYENHGLSSKKQIESIEKIKKDTNELILKKKKQSDENQTLEKEINQLSLETQELQNMLNLIKIQDEHIQEYCQTIKATKTEEEQANIFFDLLFLKKYESKSEKNRFIKVKEEEKAFRNQEELLEYKTQKYKKRTIKVLNKLPEVDEEIAQYEKLIQMWKKKEQNSYKVKKAINVLELTESDSESDHEKIMKIKNKKIEKVEKLKIQQKHNKKNQRSTLKFIKLVNQL